MSFKVENTFTEIQGKLDYSRKDKSKWKIENEIFTVCPVRNPWVVRNMKKFKAKGQTVVVRLSKNKTLLSVRAL